MLHTLARACVSHMALGRWAGHGPGVSSKAFVSPPRRGRARASLHSTKASGPTGSVWVPGTSLYPSLCCWEVGTRGEAAGQGRAGLTPRWGALGTLMGPSDRASEGLAETFPGLGCRRFLGQLLFGREWWGRFCC